MELGHDGDVDKYLIMMGVLPFFLSIFLSFFFFLFSPTLTIIDCQFLTNYITT